LTDKLGLDTPRRAAVGRATAAELTIGLAINSRRWLPYAAGLLLLGLAYRATFIAQGFNGTDEGLLQAMGARIASGQIPYRDFDYVLPPVSIYKEAGFIAVFHGAYGVLASRWVFVAEVSLASVIAFLIVRRHASDRLAFMVTLPTVFFSVILIYFSHYGYDAVFLALLSALLLFYSDTRRSVLPLLAGALAALAFLAKPPLLGFAVLVLVIGALRPRLNAPRNGGASAQPRIGTARGSFLLGFAGMFATVSLYFVANHASRRFLYDSFVLAFQSMPHPATYLIWQDMPLLLRGPAEIAGIVLLLAVVPLPRVSDAVRLGLVGAVLAAAIVLALLGKPAYFIDSALSLFLLLNLAAVVVTVLIDGPWFADQPFAIELRRQLPPLEVPLLALGLQFLSQYSNAGITYSYLGCFLSVPVGLLFLYRLAHIQLPSAGWSLGRLRIAPPVALMVGLWLVVGSAVVTRLTVYRDGDRAQLSASFRTAKLAGVTSLPSNVQRIDGIVSMVEQYTKPGDPIFVFPDLPALYFLTDRTNPTRVTWYIPPGLGPGQSEEAVADLERHPPRLIFLQTYGEGDFQRLGPPINYAREPKWQPIYRYITTHYRQIGSIGDVAVYVP
jgi:hypothetical protein